MPSTFEGAGVQAGALQESDANGGPSVAAAPAGADKRETDSGLVVEELLVEELLVEELLVEDISIDGMCGVY